MPENTRSSGLGSAGPAKASLSSSVPRKGAFYKEGEYWTVGLGGKTVRLKHSKGFAYLSYLLRNPAMEFHVLDLVGGIASASDTDEVDRSAPDSIRSDYALEKAGIHIGRLGDAGEVLDEQAKSAYRRRVAELREELEEAKAAGNVESAEQLEEKIDALTGELSRAVGLGGRSRRAASASERARQTVTKTIRGRHRASCAERCGAWKHPFELRQNRDVLCVSARGGLADRMGVRCGPCRVAGLEPGIGLHARRRGTTLASHT